MLERFSLDGRVAIVTGAGRGLGRQMALALARCGADVVCAARTPEQIESAAAEIRALGRRAITVPTDVRRSEQIDRMVARCIEAFGRVDVMLANAGGGGAAVGKRADEATDADWHDTLDTNLSSFFFCARAVIPHMRRQGGGVIISVASGTGLRGDPRLWAYATAKAGVMALTRALAAQYVRENIRVNCIVPGFVAQRPPRDEQEAAAYAERGKFIPVGRLGRADELGPLAVYLASDASSYVTGECFIIDGGGLAGGAAPLGLIGAGGKT
jgi:NAD(P)-dependent dehydrogenase (short-subunit alcohol dehydrogenase family)